MLTKLIVSHATGFKNYCNEEVREVSSEDSTIHFRMRINANSGLDYEAIMVWVNGSYNVETDTIKIVTEGGKGSKKYNWQIKNNGTIIIKHIVDSAKQELTIAIKEQKYNMYADAHKLMLSMISDDKKNTAYEHINKIQEVYANPDMSIEQLETFIATVISEFKNDTRIFPFVSNSETQAPITETIKPSNTFTAYNRTFPTYEEAHAYCIQSDFDPEHIIDNAITVTPNSSYPLQLDLQLFAQNEPISIRTKEGIQKWGIAKEFDLIYTIETTLNNSVYDDINYTNVHKFERKSLQEVFDTINNFQRRGYYNIQVWEELRHNNETIMEHCTDGQLEFSINNERLSQAKEIERENERLKQQIEQYELFIKQYKAVELFDKFKKGNVS